VKRLTVESEDEPKEEGGGVGEGEEGRRAWNAAAALLKAGERERLKERKIVSEREREREFVWKSSRLGLHM
jgi:hypothetical protein